MSRLLRAFFVGSSLPVVIWPFLYLGIPSILNSSVDFNMVQVAIGVPIAYGIYNVLLVSFLSVRPVKNVNQAFWIGGALLGLLASLYGNFVENIPTELFVLTGPEQYLTIPAAIIFYAVVWRFIVHPLHGVVGIKLP